MVRMTSHSYSKPAECIYMRSAGWLASYPTPHTPHTNTIQKKEANGWLAIYPTY